MFVKQNWTNMGDVNFFAYGGCLVKPHCSEEELAKDPALKYTYDVFYLNTEYGEEGNQNFAALCTIDLADTWLDYNKVLTFCGLEEKAGMPFEELVKVLNPEILAKEVVEYYKVFEFNPIIYRGGYGYYSEDDYILTDKELNMWLKDIGAEEHCVVLEKPEKDDISK